MAEITKEDIIEKVNSLIIKTSNDLKKNLEIILTSGSFKYSDYQNDFLLPNLIMFALLDKEKDYYQIPKNFPKRNKHIKTIKNMRYLL